MNGNVNRTERALKNTILGAINKMITTLMPFLTRTVIIYTLGMEYAGLNSLFTSILQVLNLAELGISSAVVYCMYKPIAENDIEMVCALLKYMKKIYYVIGSIVLVIGVILIPILPYVIKGDVPEGLSIVMLYCVYLINTGIGYFFFAYKSTLLNAGQNVGVISKINSAIIFLQGSAQIIVLLLFKNYYIFLIMMPIFTLLNNIWIAFAAKREYPEIACGGMLPEETKKDISIRVKGLFVSKVCITTRNAFDSIFISAYIGLTSVAIYQNYYFILSAVMGMLSVVTTAMSAGVGNSIVTESVEKNYRDFRKFNFLYNWIVGFCTCCLLTMYQPFMRIWMGKKSLFPFYMIVLLCTYFYFLNIGSIRAMYHDAAGLWWEARYRAIFEAVLNFILNFLLTKHFGVFGTILGTLIALIIINYGYGTQIVFRYYFKTISMKQYFEDNFLYGLVTIVGSAVCLFITRLFYVSDIVSLCIGFVLSVILFNFIYFLCFFKTRIFKEVGLIFNAILKRMLR